MSDYANVTIQATVTGDGRRDSLILTPLSQTSFATTAPPGALSVSSPGELMTQSLSTGDNTILSAGSITGSLSNGFPITYLIMVPPSGSTVTKTLKGASGDTGVTLANTLPLVLAIPTTAQNVIVNASGSEVVDIWLI